MSEAKKNPDELGALWVRDGAKGAYMTGSITVNGEQIKIVVFRNNFKENNEKAPDWRILKSRPKQADDDTIPVPF